MRRRMWWIMGAMGALVAVVAIMNATLGGGRETGEAEAGHTSHDSQTPTETEPEPDPSPVPKLPSTLEVNEDWDDGSELVEPFIAAESALRSDPHTPYALEDAAAGAALDDLAVQALEFTENGIVQRGTPELISAEPVSIDAESEPQSVTILLCMDYSSVDFLTPSGEEIKDPNAPNRVPSIVTLERLDGRWLVTDRTFPDDDEC